MSYGRGSFPSIAVHDAALWLVLQDFGQLRVYRDDQFVVEVSLVDASAAFPVLASMDGGLYLAFRDGTTGKVITLLTGEVQTFGQPGGNAPIQLAEGFVWWQEGGATWRAPVGNLLSREHVNGRITPTGLVAIRDGQPVYWDDVAGSQPGMIVSHYAGPLVVGEGINGGALVRELSTGRELLHWPGQISFKPTLAFDNGQYAVATWDQEVRLERGHIDALALPGVPEQPPDAPPPPPPPPTPTLQKPEVTVPRWTLDELKDGREIVFFDRENPALGYSSRVWVEDGSIYASITNAVGTGRTGARRPVKPCENGSNPDLPPGNGGSNGGIEPGPVGWRPTRDDVLGSLRADIAMADHDGQDTEWGTWEALWWDDAKFATFAERYHERGLTLVPCNLVVTNYRGVTFDFTNDLPLVKARLERCYQHRLIPMLCLTMVDARDRGADTIAILERILPELRDYLVAVFTAWELEVDGGASVFTPEEHARVIQLADEHLPGVVIGVEFASPADRGDPVIYDGRAVGEGREAPDYWRRPEAQRLDVVLLEIPHGIVGDPKRVCMEVGGAVCRLQGAFDVPDRFPDGEPITDEYRGNWRTDYGIHKHVVAFEYASFQRWSSARKRALREFVQAVIPIAGFGEG